MRPAFKCKIEQWSILENKLVPDIQTWPLYTKEPHQSTEAAVGISVNLLPILSIKAIFSVSVCISGTNLV